jgi:DnaJ-class molecular chaperone
MAERKDNVLEELSKTAGVDFIALKEKYKTLKPDASKITVTAGTSSATSNQDANQILSKYSICKTCNGQGIVKTLYNHMTLEKTCEDCDGDSVVVLQYINNEINRVLHS